MDMPTVSNVSPIFKVIQRYGPSGLSPRCAADFLRELGQFLWSPYVSVIHVWNFWTLQSAVRTIILLGIRGSVRIIWIEWAKSSLQEPGVFYDLRPESRACIFLAHWNCYINLTGYTSIRHPAPRNPGVHAPSSDFCGHTAVFCIFVNFKPECLPKAALTLSVPQVRVYNFGSCHYYLWNCTLNISQALSIVWSHFSKQRP